MSIKEYVSYLNASLFQLPQHVKDNNGMITSVPYININEWKAHIPNLQSKIPPAWLYNSTNDAMRYLCQKSKGVNHPHISLKVLTKALLCE